MFKQLLENLRKKFPKVPQTLLEGVAKKMAETVKEESEVEGAVSKLDELPVSITDFAKMLQQEGDRRVAALKKPPKKDDEEEEEEEEDEAVPPAGKSKKRESATYKLLKQLTEKMEKLEAEKTQGQLSEKLNAKLKEAKIPLVLAKGRKIEKEEELETVFDDIKNDWTAIEQEKSNSGFSQTTGTPGSGTPTVKSDVADNEIKNWAAKKSPVNGTPAKVTP
jgi:CRISPR/Cas system CSM-associated protein Csm2 small subunit